MRCFAASAAALLALLLAHCGASDEPLAAPDGGGEGPDGGAFGGPTEGGAGGDGAVQPTTATILGPGVTPADRDRVDGATPTADGAPRIDYPLAGAVMPRDVYPPNVMWTPAHAAPQPTDVYRVRLDRGVRRVEGYFLGASGFTSSWLLPLDAWPVVAAAGFADPIELSVAVLSGGVLHEGAPLAFRTVDAFLRGSVYYWSPPEQRIKRVDVGTAKVADFLPNPGTPCIGCHALSRDGRKLATQRDSSKGNGLSYAAFDLTRDLTPNPAPTLLDTPAAYGDVSFGYNGDGARLVVAGTGQNRKFFPLRVLDSTSGALVSTATTALGIDPEWAPDNSAIAYTSKGTTGDDLMVAPIASDTVGTPALLHSGASVTGATIDWHPTWSPDSQWLAFQNGVGSTAGGDSKNGSATEPGAIWLSPRAGAGARRLDRLNGAAPSSYRPFFTPFDSGGYFWLLFTSTRAYGNAQAGVSGQKQVWLAAIGDKPGAAGDPSEVPYYLAGQETTNPIISPQWAPAPCRADGDACGAAGDCCSGACNGTTCRPPAQCSDRGGSCDTSADCCAGLQCAGHVCDAPLR